MKYTLTDKEEIISSVPVFSSLSTEALHALSNDSVMKSHDRGEIIFSEGDAATGFHLLAEGRVKIFKVSPDGKEQILHIFMPGNLFGEAAVFSAGVFPASAQALEPSRTLVIPKTTLKNTISKDPEIAMKMLGMLSARLMYFSDLIENLSLKEVPGRLAAYLILQAADTAGDSIVLGITRNQLASMLGTIPETLSRILSRLQKQGIIKVEGKKITIVQQERLEGLAVGTERL